ncbi:MAG: DUF481 domain-containing protein [Aureliella sp.]
MKRIASTGIFVLAIAAAFTSTLPAQSNAAPSPETLPAPLSTAPLFGQTTLAPTTEAFSAQVSPSLAIDPLVGSPPELKLDAARTAAWYFPWTFIPLDGWTNSAELGINGSSGNANSYSFQTGARFKRKTDAHLFDSRITHNRTQSNGIEKQNNALFFTDYERFFADSPASVFMKQGVEYDRFKAFDLRYSTSAGVAYRFIRTDHLNLKGRFGSGTSREFGGPEDRWLFEGVFGGDYEHQWNKRNKFIARFDYFPEWKDFSNYRIISDTAWEMLWDEHGNLSLKIGAIDRYDSTPGGKQPNDLTYSMLLLYKF